jgi:hypothetical protein
MDSEPQADLYQFLTLQVCETHFRFRSSSLNAQRYLCSLRKKHPELSERKFTCLDSPAGVIVARLQ